MRTLVTGGAGFIGSNLAQRLVADGHDVCVVDDLSLGKRSNLRSLLHHCRFRFVQGSILNVPLMESLIQEADVVYHLAAVVGVQHVLDRPVLGIKTNVIGTDIVLELAHRWGCRAVIASSSEVYGKSTRVPLSEEDDRVFGSTRVVRWSYAESKALNEYLALGYYRQGLPVSVVRYFNSYGPHTDPNGYGSVVARFVTQALSGGPLTVYDTGKQTRSFTYVDDTVEGTVRAAVEDSALGQVINIGSKDEIAILDLARLIRDLAGSESEVVCVPWDEAYGMDYEESLRRVPDVTKARRLLGFEAQVPLEEGLLKTIEWFRSKGLDD